MSRRSPSLPTERKVTDGGVTAVATRTSIGSKRVDPPGWRLASEFFGKFLRGDGNSFWCIDASPDLSTFNRKDGDGNIITDYEGFADAA